MFTIRLNKMRFFAFHGVHMEESLIGTDFEVTIAISFSTNKKITELSDTVNYVEVFEVVKKHFDKPQKLLETVAQNITEEIYKLNKYVSSINITIDKINAPICNFTGSVGVNYLKSFS